jgi:hypothetical protein
MAIATKIERRVSHREWDEATFAASEFFDKLPHIISEAVKLGLMEADDEISALIDCPTLKFQHGSVAVDEMWGVKGRAVWTSSFTGGLAEWSPEKGLYCRYFHGTERELGALEEITFTLDERLYPLFASEQSA